MNTVDKFSLENLESIMSPEGDKAADQMVSRIKELKDGICGALWYKIKILRNDYDLYMHWWVQVQQKLHTGVVAGYTTTEGKALYNWKSNEEQLDELLRIQSAFKLTDEDITRFAAQTKERFEKRINYSGTNADRIEFEGERTRTPYAGTDNELASKEAELKQQLHLTQKRQAQLKIAN